MPYTYNYPRPSVTADSLLINKTGEGLNILLICRDKPPFEGMWALPGGFMEMDETLENAAKRELQEETGITGVELHQFYTFDKPGRDPRGRTISTVFVGFPDKQIMPKASDDAREAQWFSTHDLPPLAFDHAEIIEKALKSIKV